MNILVVNDDGWGAPGLMTLLPHLYKLGKLTVLVPDGPRSGMSNAVTVAPPVTLHRIQQAEWGTVYTTTGTPSDCVKLAINVLFGGDADAIDLVVSGINHGSNAAINLIYSGTMGACFVAAEHDIPAIGFSIDDMSEHPDFSFMEPYIDRILADLPALMAKMGKRLLLNINAPKGAIQGMRWTRQTRSYWTDEMMPVPLPNGETGYALSGHLVNAEPEATDTDQYALEHAFLSIQPCTVDMTDYAALR